MRKLLIFFGAIQMAIVGAVAGGTLFTVYMLNLDQKLLAWALAY